MVVAFADEQDEFNKGPEADDGELCRAMLVRCLCFFVGRRITYQNQIDKHAPGESDSQQDEANDIEEERDGAEEEGTNPRAGVVVCHGD